MSLMDTPNAQFLERYLDLAAYRQTLIAANVANIDTPGYRTRDVAFHSELEWASFDNFQSPLRPFVRPVYGLMERPDGNNVSLERESLLLADTQMRFNTAVQLLRDRFKMLSSAIHEGSTS